MCAKAVVGEDLWSAKVRDNDLKSELLPMIEWDHRLRHGASIDTRYLGTRMNTWMDADIPNELTHCWSHFAAALRRTTALFSRLAERVTALDLTPLVPSASSLRSSTSSTCVKTSAHDTTPRGPRWNQCHRTAHLSQSGCSLNEWHSNKVVGASASVRR